jgi:Spy/CpxP family protein refolding chaperone
MKGMKGPRHGMGGGPLGMFLHEARDLKLSDAQKTKLDELEKGLKDGDTPRDEMKTLHEDLVAGIKAGKVDTAKIDADQAAVDKAMTARREKEAEALNSLHATLEPAQRTALVADVRDKMKKREEKWKDKKVDEKAPADKPDGKDMKMKGGPGGPGMMGHFTKDLDLDDAQQKKVQAVLDKAKEDKGPPPDMAAMKDAMKKKWDSLLAEFEKDTFDAKKSEAFTDKPDMKKMGGPMNPKTLNEILPILKPEQREKLAAKMTKGPGHKGGPGMAPPPPGAPAPDGDDDDGDGD